MVLWCHPACIRKLGFHRGRELSLCDSLLRFDDKIVPVRSKTQIFVVGQWADDRRRPLHVIGSSKNPPEHCELARSRKGIQGHIVACFCLLVCSLLCLLFLWFYHKWLGVRVVVAAAEGVSSLGGPSKGANHAFLRCGFDGVARIVFFFFSQEIIWILLTRLRFNQNDNLP